MMQFIYPNIGVATSEAERVVNTPPSSTSDITVAFCWRYPKPMRLAPARKIWQWSPRSAVGSQPATNTPVNRMGFVVYDRTAGVESEEMSRRICCKRDLGPAV